MIPNEKTPNEQWSLVRETQGHQYNAQCDYVLKALGRSKGKVLVVGSPIFEAFELQYEGWDVTYVDVRKPPVNFKNFIQGDASSVDLGKDFDAASTTCVLCHAGMGRYLDPLVTDADKKILQNIRKSLKVGGKLAVMFGPVFKFEKSMPRSSIHKIYSIKDAVSITEGFGISQIDIFNTDCGLWTNKINDSNRGDSDYLSMVLEKQC